MDLLLDKIFVFQQALPVDLDTMKILIKDAKNVLKNVLLALVLHHAVNVLQDTLSMVSIVL